MTVSPHPVSRFFAYLFVSLLCLGSAPFRIHAATFYWDVDPNTASNQNGSGTWVSGGTPSTANWTSSAGGSNAAWVNGANNANLGGTSGYTNNGTGGTLTLGENITLTRIDKSSQTTAYIIEPGAGNYTITLTGSNPGFGNNNASAAAALTINAQVLGVNLEFLKFNNGTVILNATNTWTGGTRITAHTTSGSTSVLQIGTGGTTGTLGSGNVTFATTGASTGAQSVLAFNRSDDVTLSQNLVSGGVADPNKGILRQLGSGTLIVSSANTAFTGTLEVRAGTLQIGDGSTNGAVATASGADISSGATLRFDRSDAITFNVPITGAGRVLKANDNTLTLTGAGSTHTGITEIATGVLQIGNDNALSTATTVAFTGTGVLDLNGFDQTVSTLTVANGIAGSVIGASGSTLTVGNTNLTIGGTAVSTTASLDLSGLDEFIFNGPGRVLSVGGQFSTSDGTATVSSGTLTLAQNNTILASSVNVSNLNGGGGNHENSGTLLLGQTNSITAANFNIGAIYKNQGFVRFADGITDGTLTLRGTNAAQRMDILISKHDSNGVIVDQSYFDSTGGTLDALVGTLTLAVNNDRFRSALGRFTMGAGTLDATTIILGQRLSSANTSVGSGASPTGVLELNGGTIIAGTLIFADKQDANDFGTVTGIFNFNSGTLRAQTIRGGAGSTAVSRLLKWSSGSIETYDASTDLTINDVTITLEGTGTRIFNVATDRTITLNSPIINGTSAPSVAFVKQGTGTLLLGGTGSTHTGSINLEEGILRTSVNDTVSDGATIHFTGNATLDLQDHSEVIRALNVTTDVTATVQGSGGSLTVSNSPNWVIGSISANTDTVLDLSGLSNFTFDSSTADIQLGSQGNQASNFVTVYLASLDNIITAKSFGIASVVSGATAGSNVGRVYLGQDNQINANNITVGDFKSTTEFTFQDGITNGTLTLRATNGTGRATLLIGRGQSGSAHTNASMDVSAGSLDALISTLTIGQNDNRDTQASNTTASLTMGAGILDATTIILGDLSNNSSNSAYTATGTLTLAGTGTVKANTITLSQRSSTGNGFSNGIFNLSGGIVQAGTIQRGSAPKGTSTFNWNSGTLQNYDASTDLAVSGVDLTLNGTGSRSFHVTAGRTATVNSSLVNGTGVGSDAFTKTGTGTLALTQASTYSGVTTVQEGTLLVTNTTGSATGVGSIQISNSGLLAGNGRLAPEGSAGVTNQGTLKAGLIDSTGASGLTLDLGSTTGGLQSTGTLSFDLFTNAGDNTGIASSADRLTITQATAGDISLSGILEIGLGSGSSLNPASSFAEGDRWLLIDWSGLTGGTPSVNFSQVVAPELTLSGNLAWYYEFDTSGLYAVVIVAVPEPGRIMLLGVGLVSLFLRRRRPNVDRNPLA